ncbi:hypothetical protein GGX14DRAFT_406779 [Mycena pura]|uniref:Uncharacterized protein n=1 Tax=Mycena pura TaxID=153505 RepID=A0AAD6UPT8_9AGAR|nr:hypothetical protein GGX14DRAFT_406779 [Mycena pura]
MADANRDSAQFTAAMGLIAKAGNGGLARQEHRSLQAFMDSTKDSSQYSKTHLEVLLKRSLSGSLLPADLEILRTAAPVEKSTFWVEIPRSRYSRKAILNADNADIRAAIEGLGVHAADARQVLERLDALSQATTKVFKVAPLPAMFKDNIEKNPKIGHRPASLEKFSVITEIVKCTRGDNSITIGLVAVWQRPNLDFLTEDFHANMLMVIHAPSGVNPSPGKAFAVFDPNVINTTEGMPNKRMQQLVRSVIKDKPLTPVYLNKLPKDRNNDGRCLQRALLHMLDLINCGKQFSANIHSV